MAKQFIILVLLGVAIGGGWYAVQRYEVRLIPRGDQPAHSAPAAAAPTQLPVSSRTTIRIAALNLAKFDETRLANPRAREILAQVINRFDLVAVQALTGANQALVLRLVELASTPQRQYDFALCDAVQNDATQQYAAFIFDRASIEVDRQKVQEIRVSGPPAGRFLRKPLVGLFRTLGPDPAEAFTFCLISVDLDPDRASEELALLPDVYRGVRDNSWNEDDVILLGTLHTDAVQLDALKDQLNVTAAIISTPTTTRGTQLADNILFNRRATSEYTGRSGVLDLIREFGLSMPEALEISEHLPIWAEFSVYEGGQAGHVTAAGRETR